MRPRALTHVAPPIAQELVELAGAANAVASAVANGSSVSQLALAAAKSEATGKSEAAVKMLHSAVTREAGKRLRGKTALVARSGLDMLHKVATPSSPLQ